MQKRFGIVIVVLLILILALSSVSVFADFAYGEQRYGVGSYGFGEEDNGAASSGGGAGGGGNSGSSETSRSEDTGTISLETPNDLPGDVAESSLEVTCESGPCSITSAEVNNLPADIASAYEDEGGLFVAAIRLACTGEIGLSTVDFTIDASEDLNCDGIRVTMVEDDGSRSSLEQVECTENDDGSLHVQATFNTCSYVILWQASDQLQPTLEQLSTSDQGAEEETMSDQGLEVQEAEGSGGLTVLVVALVLIILVVIIISIVRKKKSKF